MVEDSTVAAVPVTVPDVDATLEIPDEWHAAFAAAGLNGSDPTGSVVLAAVDVPDWEAAQEIFGRAFELSQTAAQSGRSVVYVIHQDDLLGRRGPSGAMVANGLLSGCRTLALEVRKSGATVNTLAINTSTPLDLIASWCYQLLAGTVDGPNGELIQLGGNQIGKALS